MNLNQEQPGTHTGNEILLDWPRHGAGEVTMPVNPYWMAVKELVKQREYWRQRIINVNKDGDHVEYTICSDQIRNINMALEAMKGATQ